MSALIYFSLQGRILGIEGLFISKVIDVAIKLSHECDDSVSQNADRIKQEATREEER